MSCVSHTSLIPTGRPWSKNLGSPRRPDRSRSRACVRACAGLMYSHAPMSHSFFSMRARHALTSSSDVISPWRISSSARVADRWQSSSVIIESRPGRLLCNAESTFPRITLFTHFCFDFIDQLKIAHGNVGSLGINRRRFLDIIFVGKLQFVGPDLLAILTYPMNLHRILRIALEPGKRFMGSLNLRPGQVACKARQASLEGSAVRF